ncbi:lysylphosphatidylglycerol synthase transmembrane domain-containing protein [Roseivirga sp. BDSF3-8]|uniref:lysylphosphatidylglycerol synthase transmembrane domain-containing protein n=1 Tax=Roseivirga sp. BDSF3-8 TaxID=3241598 RepID=UPI00353182C1
MDIDSKKIFKTLNPKNVWIPIVIGVGIVFYLFASDESIRVEDLRLVLNAKTLPIILAFLVLFMRDAGYVARLRTITGKELSWGSCVFTIIMWEFASAVTPSVVGGTAVAVFIMNKEGLNLGKSLAFVMVTAIFDNLFFVVAAPLILLVTGGDIFPEVATIAKLGINLKAVFYVSYSLIAFYTSVMAFALFVRPRGFKWLLIRLTSNRLLKRWRYKAYEHGNEIIMASAQLKGKGFAYWFKISLFTIFIWSARYILLNALMSAFAGIDLNGHLTIFARQIILWIVMLFSPTPGSSGTAELAFPVFFENFLGNYTIGTNILWRLFTYYLYLLLGALVLPRWIRRVFFKKKAEEDKLKARKEEKANNGGGTKKAGTHGDTGN